MARRAAGGRSWSSALLVTVTAGLLPLAFVEADTRLIEAASEGRRDVVVALLSGQSEVDSPGPDGSTALHHAIAAGHGEIVELLLAEGAQPDQRTRTGVTPLALAALDGDAAIIGHLLEAGADPNGLSSEGETPLMLAASNGRPAAVTALLQSGADPNLTEPFRGQTALMWAAGEGNADAASLLIAAGADIEARSTAGFSALLFAVREARLDPLRALIDVGANVNALAPDGTSALNVAVVNGYYEVASVLLEHGADPNLPDPRGSPLHTIAWLREPGATGNAAVGAEADAPVRASGSVTSLEIARRLLDAGADPNVRIDWNESRFNKLGGTARNPPGLILGRHLLTFNGATAFYIAAKNGDAELMRVLADGGADPLITNRFGITPLMVAAGLDTWEGETPGPHTGVSEAERLEAVRLAVELGNDVNARADFGDYPMEGPPDYTLLYYPYNVDDLVDLGVGDPRWDDSTALHGSIISNQPSLTQYLIDQGAEPDVENALGWTPLMMARGVFLANASREFPEAEAILLGALEAASNE
ncbi:MAG: ankyrin repeat domain-containing protein [Gammaproteobacteria bacterium]|jgi:ankyrin repeat protein